MSEYPIGLNGEMIHCLDDSPYAEYCRSKLEEDLKTTEDKSKWKKKSLKIL